MKKMSHAVKSFVFFFCNHFHLLFYCFSSIVLRLPLQLCWVITFVCKWRGCTFFFVFILFYNSQFHVYRIFFCCLCNNNRIISIPYRHRTIPFIFLSLYDWSSFELKGKTNILRKELLLLWVTVTSREINI